MSNGCCSHLREDGNRRLSHPEHGKISRSTGCAEWKKNKSVEASELSHPEHAGKQSRVEAVMAQTALMSSL